MVHLRDVHRHLAATADAHRQTHQDALREAAVARAQLEAQQAAESPTGPSEGNPDGG